MKTIRIWNELVSRNSPLAYAGLLFLVMGLLMPVLMLIDGRQVLGLDPWVKPMKFDLSTVVYLWTLGWLFDYLQDRYPRSVKWMTWMVIVFMLLEIACVKMQAARGVSSHFNNQTSFDGMVFSFMGIVIFLNTAVMVYAWVLFLRFSPAIAPAYLMGIRIGFFVFLLGCLAGIVMAAQNGHSVGVTDGGPGLPFLNWSMTGGDLRPIHFLGLHALQLFPLVGYYFSRYRVQSGKLSPALLTVCLCLGYTVLSLWLFQLALAGKPLVAIKAKQSQGAALSPMATK